MEDINLIVSLQNEHDFVKDPWLCKCFIKLCEKNNLLRFELRGAVLYIELEGFWVQTN